ncbi:MAG: peptidylprolyl isomerase [Gammaproteobacteria bacterium]|nr:peptidylprolyl isomerase [Gammaproteobacteria bacterium]MBL6998377.1 peptidylprolyl isomerase [Gammaproteobacteria bacterium]
MKRFFVFLLFFSSLVQAQAQTGYIDSIIAIVEDDVITNTELTNEVSRIRQDYASKGRNLAPSNSLNRQVLELMIIKSILIQEAAQRGVTITETQLNSTMQNLAANNKKTLGQFREALLASGIDYDDFRDDIKDELAINTIKNSYANQNIDISEQEIDDFINRRGSDSESLEYKLSHILIALPDGASTEQITTARVRAEDIISQLKQGADFAELAQDNSAGGNALEGGDLGWRKLAQIPSLFTGIVQPMQIGEYSQPIRSASGFHLVRLDDKRDSEQVIVEQTHARHILIKPDQITSDEQARQQLESIREEILKGADFTELAKKYSDDPGSKGLGGDLGWFDKGTMVPTFEQVLDSTSPGETSAVFRSRFGWHFLQVLGRKKVDDTEETKRKKILEQLQTQKKDEVLELWQRRLRDQAFVKVMDDNAE